MTEAAQDCKQKEMEMELERLQQLEDLCQRFDEERERHRQEREQDAATIDKLRE